MIVTEITLDVINKMILNHEIMAKKVSAVLMVMLTDINLQRRGTGYF